MITLKRVYEEWSQDDGFRILVDRLWPRGLTKQRAHADLWLKDIAPSNELRKWFGHDPKKWKEFKEKYFDELRSKESLLEELKSLEKKYGTITLLYGAKNVNQNEAVVLAETLKRKDF